MTTPEDDRFARDLAAAHQRGDMAHFAGVVSERLRQMDKRAKAANKRADAASASAKRAAWSVGEIRRSLELAAGKPGADRDALDYAIMRAYHALSELQA